MAATKINVELCCDLQPTGDPQRWKCACGKWAATATTKVGPCRLKARGSIGDQPGGSSAAVQQPITRTAIREGKPLTAEWFPCVHRGEFIVAVPCNLCGDRERMEPVYQCAVHGECAMRRVRKDGKGVQACLSCRDRVE